MEYKLVCDQTLTLSAVSAGPGAGPRCLSRPVRLSRLVASLSGSLEKSAIRSELCPSAEYWTVSSRNPPATSSDLPARSDSHQTASRSRPVTSRSYRTAPRSSPAMFISPLMTSRSQQTAPPDPDGPDSPPERPRRAPVPPGPPDSGPQPPPYRQSHPRPERSQRTGLRRRLQLSICPGSPGPLLRHLLSQNRLTLPPTRRLSRQIRQPAPLMARLPPHIHPRRLPSVPRRPLSSHQRHRPQQHRRRLRRWLTVPSVCDPCRLPPPGCPI